MIGKGKAGQASIRDTKNKDGKTVAFGIPTKQLPSMNDNAFFSDTVDEAKAVMKSLRELYKLKQQGWNIVFPEDGLGTGLARMKEKSPKTFKEMNNIIKEHFGVDYSTEETSTVEDVEVVEVVEPAKEVKKKKLGEAKLPSGEKVTIVKVPSENMIAKDGTEILAKYNRDDKEVWINENSKLVEDAFKNKQWTKSRKQSDGSYSKPLKENVFKNVQELIQFLTSHEIAHETLGKRKPDETIGEYETRVNDEAARWMKIDLYETNIDDMKKTVVEEVSKYNNTDNTTATQAKTAMNQFATKSYTKIKNIFNEIFDDSKDETQNNVAKIFNDFYKIMNSREFRKPKNYFERYWKQMYRTFADGYTVAEGKNSMTSYYNPAVALKIFSEGFNAFSAFQYQFATDDIAEIVSRFGVDAKTAAQIKKAGGDREAIIRAIGGSIMKSLDMKLHGDAANDTDTKDMMARSIGLFFLDNLKHLGLLEETYISIEGDKRKMFIKINEDKVAKYGIEKFTDMLSVTSKSGQEAASPPTLEVTKPKKEHEVKGQPGFIGSQNKTDSINKREKQPNKINYELLDFFEEFSESDIDLILGLIPDEELQPSFRENNKFRSNSIKLKYRLGIDFINNTLERAKDATFYLQEFVGGNGRMYIQNQIMNLQTDKFFARHITKIGESYYVTNKTNWYAAIGLAMDKLKPENVNPKLYEGKFKEILDEWSDVLDAINNNSLTDKQRNQIAVAANKAEGMWTLQAIQEMARYKKANGNFKKFKSDMTIEIDGVTNGLAFLVFQAGEMSQDILRRIGVFFGTDKFNSIWEYKEAGGLDNYEALAANAKEKFNNLPENKLTKLMQAMDLFDRKMAKSPLMVFLYGMNMEAINKEVSENMVERIINSAFDGNKDANAIIDIIYGKVDINKKVFTSYEIEEMGKELIQYSEILTESLEDIYPNITKYRTTMRSSGELLFRMFQVLSSVRPEIANATAHYNRGDTKLSKEAKELLTKILPSVSSFGTSEDYRTNLMLIGKLMEPTEDRDMIESNGEKVSVKEHYSVVVNSTIDGKQNKMNSIPRNVVWKTSASAAPVTPIHNLDGDAAGASHNGVPNHPGINVHDAVIALVNNIGEFGVAYNKAFYRGGTEYSVLEAMDSAVTALYSEINKTMTDKQINNLIVKLQKNDEVKEEKIIEVDDVLKDLAISIGHKNDFDSKIVPQISTVAQMNGADGVAYTANKLYAGARADLSAIQVKLLTDVKGLFKTLLGTSTLDSGYESHLDKLIDDMTMFSPENLKNLKAGYDSIGNKKATVGEYNSRTREIRIGIGSRASMHPAVAYVHELVHAVTKTGLDLESSWGLRRRLEDFATSILIEINKSDSFTDKEKKNYTEWITKAPAEEILSYGITDKKLIELLRSMPYQEKKSVNLFEFFMNQFNKFVRKAMALAGVRNDDAYTQLSSLFAAAMTANVKAMSSNDPTATGRIESAMNVMNEKFRESVTSVGKSFAKVTKIDQLDGTELVDEFNDIVKNRMKFDLENNRTVQSLKNSWFGTDSIVARNINKIAKEYRVKIENQSNSLKDSYVKTFNKYLDGVSDKVKGYIKRAVIDTDMTSLIYDHNYSLADISHMIASPEYLQSEIDSMKFDSKNREYHYFAKALAIFMNTGVNTIAYNFTNAIQVVDKVGGNISVSDVDKLASLYALQKMDKEAKQGIKVFLRNKNAKQMTDAINKTKLDTDRLLFNANEQKLKIKGFSNNDFEADRDIRIVSIDEPEAIEALTDAGYSVLQSDSHKVIMMSKTPTVAFIQGYSSTIDSKMKGEKIRVTNLEVELAYDEAIEAAKKGTEPEIEYDDNGMPMTKEFYTKNTNGENIKRYIMSKPMMRKYMGLEERIGHVAGSTAARILRKSNAQKLNTSIMALVLEEYETDYENNKRRYNHIILPPQWTGNRQAYRDGKRIYMNQDKESKEIADMLPASLIHQIRETGKNEFYVRKEMKDIIYGYRELYLKLPTSIDVGGREFTMENRKYHNKTNKLLRIVDVYQKGLVSLLKKRVVLFNPIVHYGNALSNMAILKWNGVGMKDIYDGFVDGAYMVNKYREDMAMLLEYQITNTGSKKEIARLQKSIKTNPITESMNEGLFSFIMEDLANEVAVKYNPTEKLLEETIAKGFKGLVKHTRLSKKDTAKLETTLKRLYVTESTPEGMALTTAMQYSDFLAKHVLYLHKKNKGVPKEKALQDANDFFIDYSYNDSRMLNYLNAVGIFPFSKFALRIQKPAAKLMWDRPTQLFTWMVVGDIVDDTFSSIGANNIYLNNFGQPFKNIGFGLDPSDVIQTPYTVVFK